MLEKLLAHKELKSILTQETDRASHERA